MTAPGGYSCRIGGESHDDTVGCRERDPRIGMRIADRYIVTRLIGHGGMGSVYEAKHATIQRRFAIKFLLPEFARNREVLRRFENEAKAAGRLEHIHIAAVTDFGHADDGSPYLVMEYLPGQDCATQLAKSGAFSVARATHVIYQACLGLSVAHRAGIIHRDIKPENLFLLRTDDGEDIVKLLDFGIAKLRNSDSSAMTASGVTMGTIFYMSPEQIRDSGKVDQRSDVWALGVLLYELLANQRPFGGQNVTEAMYQIVHAEPQRIESLRSDVPLALASAVHRALEKDPARRTATPDELAEQIRPFTNRPSLRASPPDPALDDTVASPGDRASPRRASTSQLGATEIPSTPRPSARMPWLWIALVSATLGMAGAGIWMASKAQVVSHTEANAPSVEIASAPALSARVADSSNSETSATPTPTSLTGIGQLRTESEPSSDRSMPVPKAQRSPSPPPITSNSVAPARASADPLPPTVPPESAATRKPTPAPGGTIEIDHRNPF